MVRDPPKRAIECEMRTRSSHVRVIRDLYVQAMYNMSKLDSHDPYSFFQIAGNFLPSAR